MCGVGGLIAYFGECDVLAHFCDFDGHFIVGALSGNDQYVTALDFRYSIALIAQRLDSHLTDVARIDRWRWCRLYGRLLLPALVLAGLGIPAYRHSIGPADRNRPLSSASCGTLILYESSSSSIEPVNKLSS